MQAQNAGASVCAEAFTPVLWENQAGEQAVI